VQLCIEADRKARREEDAREIEEIERAIRDRAGA
jgi:hypothetical protein